MKNSVLSHFGKSIGTLAFVLLISLATNAQEKHPQRIDGNTTIYSLEKIKEAILDAGGNLNIISISYGSDHKLDSFKGKVVIPGADGNRTFEVEFEDGKSVIDLRPTWEYLNGKKELI